MNVYGRICTFPFWAVVLLVAATVQCSKIHERMTDDEITNIFHTTRDKIPEYEVVPVRHNRYKRSSQNLRLQFNAFGQKIDAYLNPTDGLLMGADTPVWISFRTFEGKIEFRMLQKGIVGTVVSSFINPTDTSSIAVLHPPGKSPSFRGVLHGYRLRSMPERFREEMRSKRNTEAFNATRTLLETDYHIVIKSKSATEEEKIIGLEKQIGKALQSGNETDTSRVKRSSQDIIYPSLLIQTDYQGASSMVYDIQHSEEILYQVAFWNGVDMRYRSVDNPKIRLRIAGIIIGAGRSATPYLQKHRTGDVIDAGAALNDAYEYWYKMRQQKDFPHNAYDIVVTMTDSDMTHEGNMLQGLAAQSSSCIRPAANTFYAIAVIRDKRGFDGIIPAAHELGHVFGLYHDSESGTECSNGFIMAPRNKISLNNLKWSPCSLRSLSYFLRQPKINCFDTPDAFHPPGNPVQRLLPGDVWGANAQCEQRGYAGACDPTPDMCTLMQCTHAKPFVSGSSDCIKIGPAAEGTLCKPGHKCLDGVCQCMTLDCISVNP